MIVTVYMETEELALRRKVGFITYLWTYANDSKGPMGKSIRVGPWRIPDRAFEITLQIDNIPPEPGVGAAVTRAIHDLREASRRRGQRLS